MRWVIIMALGVFIYETAKASCLPSPEPCNDVIYQEVETKPSPTDLNEKYRIAKDPAPNFHWTDEKDPVEREWLKENWE